MTDTTDALKSITAAIDKLGDSYNGTTVMQLVKAINEDTPDHGLSPPEKFLARSLSCMSAAYAVAKMQKEHPDALRRALVDMGLIKSYRDGVEALELTLNAVRLVLKEYEQ